MTSDFVPVENQELSHKKRPCIKRALSGYNLFCQEKSSLPDFKKLSVKDRFTTLAKEWQHLSGEQRDAYNRKAKDRPQETIDVKKETKKSLEKMVSIIDHLQAMDDVEVVFVCVGGGRGNTYGGSERGRAFMETNMNIIDDFSLFVDAGKKSQQNNAHFSVVTAKDIRKLFNSKYASAVGKPSAKMPYSSLQEKGIYMEGMPAGLKIRRPGEYGSAQRKKLWMARKELKCIVQT